MGILRWLHLSDIHFQGNEKYETRKMRDKLIDKLKEIVSEKNINMIFITGDLVYQGSNYDNLLKDFIKKIASTVEVSIDDLYMIPGNHDLKRSQTRNFIIKGIREKDTSLESETIDDLLKGFDKYNLFYKELKNKDCDYIYSIINREKINIMLMNTALAAGTDDDNEKLIIEKEQFYDTIKNLKDKEDCVNIVLGHHPISYFTPSDQSKIFNNFSDYNIDLYLCGHEHKGGYKYDLPDERTIESYKCGGGMVDNYATVTFVIADLNVNKKTGKLTYYKWLEEEECWSKGGVKGRRAISGEIDLILDRFKNHDCESYMEIDINEDEFRRFIMQFHEKLEKENLEDVNIDPKDVFDKFRNMKCNKSIFKQYDSFCRYFQVINEIMNSSLLSQIEKESIPNVVISEYNKLISNLSNGNEIIERIVENIFKEYSNSLQYSNTKLKIYFKILVYWSIYECDIFNDEL